jgi:hypothetical protein
MDPSSGDDEASDPNRRNPKGRRRRRRRYSWGETALEGGATGGALLAEGVDDVAGVADLGDAQAEVLADFYGVAGADAAVVDEEFEGLLGAFGELDDGSDADAHDFLERDFPLGEADDDRDL